MAEQMARVLIPGGSVIALCGHSQLQLVLNAMSEHIADNLTKLVDLRDEARQQLDRLIGARVALNFKPAVRLVKDFYRGTSKGSFPQGPDARLNLLHASFVQGAELPFVVMAGGCSHGAATAREIAWPSAMKEKLK